MNTFQINFMYELHVGLNNGDLLNTRKFLTCIILLEIQGQNPDILSGPTIYGLQWSYAH